MKERFVMTSFLMAGIADVGTTMLALSAGNPAVKEVGLLPSVLVESGNANAAYIARMAVTAVYIGIYALSKEHSGPFSIPVDRAMRIVNLMSWGIAALNAVQLAVMYR